jgi:hypothetical protein
MSRPAAPEPARAQPQLVAIEATDIRELDSRAAARAADLVTVDVSFISLKLVLPSAFWLARTPAQLLALICRSSKPAAVRQESVVRDPAVHAAVCDDIAAFVAAHGWQMAGMLRPLFPAATATASSSSRRTALELRLAALSLATASLMVPRYDIAEPSPRPHHRRGAVWRAETVETAGAPRRWR